MKASSEVIADRTNEATILFADVVGFTVLSQTMQQEKLVAGVIGKSKFIYDLWGDSVNTASRMESHGVEDKIHVSKEVYLKLKDKFEFEDKRETK